MELRELAILLIDYFFTTADHSFNLNKLKAYYSLSSYDLKGIKEEDLLKEAFLHLYLTLTYRYKDNRNIFMKAEISEFILSLLNLIIKKIRDKSKNLKTSKSLNVKLAFFRTLIETYLIEYLDGSTSLRNKDQIKQFATTLSNNVNNVLYHFCMDRKGTIFPYIFAQCLQT